MGIDRIKSLNEHIEIKDIQDRSFKKYGKVIEQYDFTPLMNYMEDKTQIPSEGNIYLPSDSVMEQFQVAQRIRKEVYGDMDIQIGYCNGRNSSLNGVEYHKCNEIDIAVTDLILLLGQVQDIENNTYNSKLIEAFYIPKGTAVELYGTTLHFAPCKTGKQGFKCIVVLTRDTNIPLGDKSPLNMEKENRILFAKNKWLIVHPEKENLIEKSAFPGIIGKNTKINYK